MFKYFSFSRHIVAFVLAAPFFMAALNKLPVLFDQTDRLIAPSGYQTADLRAAFGRASGKVIDDLWSRSGEFYTPSEIGRGIDNAFPGGDFESRLSFADDAAKGAKTAREELLELVRG